MDWIIIDDEDQLKQQKFVEVIDLVISEYFIVPFPMELNDWGGLIE